MRVWPLVIERATGAPADIADTVSPFEAFRACPQSDDDASRADRDTLRT